MTNEQSQQLKRYKELMDVGVLTPDEYKQLKAKLLQIEMIALDLEQSQNPQTIIETRAEEQANKKKLRNKKIKRLINLFILLLIFIIGFTYLQSKQKHNQKLIQINEKNAITKINNSN